MLLTRLQLDKIRKMICAQGELRSAWASAQSDQSLLCAFWVAKDLVLLHADSKDSGLGAQVMLFILSYCCSMVLQISPRKKLFFHIHSTNKNSKTRTFAEVRFCLSSRRPFFFLRETPRKLLSRRFSAKSREDTPRKLLSHFKKCLQFKFCFVWFMI